MITEDKVTELFFMADEFLQVFWLDDGKIYIKEHGEAFLSSGFIPLKVEIMLIIILFHDSWFMIPFLQAIIFDNRVLGQ